MEEVNKEPVSEQGGTVPATEALVDSPVAPYLNTPPSAMPVPAVVPSFVMKEFKATEQKVGYYMVHGQRVRLRPHQVYKYKLHNGQKETKPYTISVVKG